VHCPERDPHGVICHASSAIGTQCSNGLWVKHDVFWAQLDVFNRIFDAVSDDPDIEYAVIDGTIFKVHCRGQGAKGKS
jgi:hypothetical protein